MAGKEVKAVLKAKTNQEVLSYIINQSPILSEEIDLPVQGQDIKPIGDLIISNERYKNAFLDIVNVIGLTVIKRNAWSNPWDFTDRGVIPWGQSVREIINDLAAVYDYNDNAENILFFAQNAVPDIYEYIHDINFQKLYVSTTSDDQIAMAFNTPDGFYDLIANIVENNFETFKYDWYLVNKYMLCRRAVSGTMSPSYIADFDNLTPRQRVSALKTISNKMIFRRPDYNPAAIRRATPFEKQILIVNSDFEAAFSTEVMATSFFKDEADMRARLKLCDSFGEHDEVRLKDVLGKQYIPFTSAELAQLKKIPAILISDEWFMDYFYNFGTDRNFKNTDFFNPTTLKNNHFLHVWAVLSTSPFENGVVFTPTEPSITNIAINPSEFSVSAGGTVQLTATVTANGFANKSVVWSITKGETAGGVTATISSTGLLSIPSGYPSTGTAPQIEITATSIYDNTKSATASVTVL